MTPSARALALAREALGPCAGPSECATADGTHDKLSCHSCAWCGAVAQAIDRAVAERTEEIAKACDAGARDAGQFHYAISAGWLGAARMVRSFLAPLGET